MRDQTEIEIIKTLESVWLHIDWDGYSQSMIKNIYPFFTSRIRASANQSASFNRFAELLTRRMKSACSTFPVEITNEKEFLRRCRDETTYLVALFRQANFERQENKPKKDPDMKGLPF